MHASEVLRRGRQGYVSDQELMAVEEVRPPRQLELEIPIWLGALKHESWHLVIGSQDSTLDKVSWWLVIVLRSLVFDEASWWLVTVLRVSALGDSMVTLIRDFGLQIGTRPTTIWCVIWWLVIGPRCTDLKMMVTQNISTTNKIQPLAHGVGIWQLGLQRCDRVEMR